MSALSIVACHATAAGPLPWRLRIEFAIDQLIAFDVDLVVEFIDADGQRLTTRHAHADGASAAWLPRGEYAFDLLAPSGELPIAAGQIVVTLLAKDGPDAVRASTRIDVRDAPVGRAVDAARFVLTGTPDPAQLAWKRGPADWFSAHFDHAATTIGSYLMRDHPALRGRVLDVGCGDGITDLGLYLRYRPETLIGIDPFRGYQRLASVAAAQHLPLDPWPERLQFLPEDANALPFPDNSFDAVISWGAFEHIVGGYQGALKEIRRVLKPDGPCFMHPGLYYSRYGHHLAEYTSEPFAHLTQSEDNLHTLVMNTPANYIDRAGDFPSPAQAWQWYQELNKITLDSFEHDLRAHGFEPWRVAVRSDPTLDYCKELLPYSISTLATAEVYLSCFNRK